VNSIKSTLERPKQNLLKNIKETLGVVEEIYFMHAVHPEYQSKAVCRWIKKGECKTLQTTGKPSCLHFARALSLERMQLVVNEYESVNDHAIIDFFKKLENESIRLGTHKFNWWL